MIKTIIYHLACASALGWHCYTHQNGIRAYNELEARYNKKMEQLTVQQQSHDTVQKKIALFKERLDFEREKTAREELLMIAPGEQMYYFIQK